MEKTPSPSAHTPAPWHVDDASGYSRICIKPWPGPVICDLCPLGDEAQENANAHLIAAAPDLLTALETVNEWSITASGDDFPYWVVEPAIDRARGLARPLPT
jgi:hypothetical protein